MEAGKPFNFAALAAVERIYLIGARGSGKTTVGRLLAIQLGYGFCDLDHYLCDKENASVPEIVAKQGWAGFRRLESEVLREASHGSRLVFATGGGVILDSENRDFMRQKGRIIWLKTEPEILCRRLAANPGERPALTSLEADAEVRAVLLEREPLYAGCCHHLINGGLDAEQVCEYITKALGIAD